MLWWRLFSIWNGSLKPWNICEFPVERLELFSSIIFRTWLLFWCSDKALKYIKLSRSIKKTTHSTLFIKIPLWHKATYLLCLPVYCNPIKIHHVKTDAVRIPACFFSDRSYTIFQFNITKVMPESQKHNSFPRQSLPLQPNTAAPHQWYWIVGASSSLFEPPGCFPSAATS